MSQRGRGSTQVAVAVSRATAGFDAQLRMVELQLKEDTRKLDALKEQEKELLERQESIDVKRPKMIANISKHHEQCRIWIQIPPNNELIS